MCCLLGHLAPVHPCASLRCCVACAVSWTTLLLFAGALALCLVLRVPCPGLLGSRSPVRYLGALCCLCGLLGNLAPVHRFDRSMGFAVCPGPLGSRSLVCSLSALCYVCGVLGHLAPVYRCARPRWCVAYAVSWAVWLLFTGVPRGGVVLRVPCSGPLGFCSPVRSLGALCCMCGVLGNLPPVHRCAHPRFCFASAVSWASWLLFTSEPAPCGVLCVHLASAHRCARQLHCVACAVSSATCVLVIGVPARCVVLRVPCPGPLGSSSPVRSLGALCCMCGVLSWLAPVHRCARPRFCVACAVSWATWLLFSGVPAPCGVCRVPCPGPLGSCSLVCLPGVWCCVCGVLDDFAPGHPCARSVCCVACAVSWATGLLFAGVPAGAVVLRVRCPRPLGPCSGVCQLAGVCFMCGLLGHLASVSRCACPVRSVACGVLGHLAPVQRCACPRCGVACAVPWATGLLFTGVTPRGVVLRVPSPGPLGSSSAVCQLEVLCCMCSVLDEFASVRWCACSVPCVACAVSWASWLSFAGALPSCVVLPVRCPGQLGSCSPVRPLGVFCCVSWATWLTFASVLARGGVLHVRCPGPLGSCSRVCPPRAFCCVCGVLRHLAPVRRCASPRCGDACGVSWATWPLFTGVPAQCGVLRMWSPRALGFFSPVCPPGALCCLCGVLGHWAPVYRCAPSVRCVACAMSPATCFLLNSVRARCLVLLVRCPGQLGSCSQVCLPEV